MSVNINSVEDHKVGSFYIDVRIEGAAYRRFASMVEAMGFVHHEKERRQQAEANITLKEIVVMPMKTMLYESAYCV